MPRIDFYVTEAPGAEVRMRLACRIAEKAYLAQQKVVVLLDDGEALRRFDELLWTFGDGSFVPHDSVSAPNSACEAPVALTTGRCPPIIPTWLLNRRRRTSISSASRIPRWTSGPAGGASRPTARVHRAADAGVRRFG